MAIKCGSVKLSAIILGYGIMFRSAWWPWSHSIKFQIYYGKEIMEGYLSHCKMVTLVLGQDTLYRKVYFEKSSHTAKAKEGVKWI